METTKQKNTICQKYTIRQDETKLLNIFNSELLQNFVPGF